MNQYDAPTSFITPISFRRLKIVIWRAFTVINIPPTMNVRMSQNMICFVNVLSCMRFFDTLVRIEFPVLESSFVVMLEIRPRERLCLIWMAIVS